MEHEIHCQKVQTHETWKKQQPNQPYTMKSGQERVVIGQVKAEKDIGVRFDEKLLLELRANAFRVIPLVILNNAMAFVYAYIQCLDGPVNWFSLSNFLRFETCGGI